MSDVAISVRGLSKRYRVFDNQRSRLLHAFVPGSYGGVQEIWALRDIDLEVRRGEAVAVIGRNGSGKSTLLQILTGTLTATEGDVTVNGRVSALLELGSGFNPEFTGRDNVILNGLLLGLTRAEILRRFDEIVAFAEIGDALERPVKTYSSGMIMRLAFAVQVLTDPDILLIDEALSVGDFFFQQKCLGYLRSLKERGVTLLFVSHDMGTVRDLCRKALYLKQGHLHFSGEAQTAIRHYLAEGNSGLNVAAFASVGASERVGDREFAAVVRESVWSGPAAGAAGPRARLIAVALYDETGAPTTSFRMGDMVHIKVAYVPAADFPTHVSTILRNKFNQVITSLGSSRIGVNPPPRMGELPLIFEIRIKLLLEAGNYSLAVHLSRLTAPNEGVSLDAAEAIGPISVHWDYGSDVAPFLGMCGLDAYATFKCVSDAQVNHAGE